MNIYEVGGAPDWVCANSEEEAEKIYCKFQRGIVGLSEQEIDDELKEYPPSVLEEAELDNMKYIGDEGDTFQSFREELARRTKPEMFAFSDY